MATEHHLLRRQRAVDACLKRFNGQPLLWGREDCVKLAALALRKQGVAVPLLKGVRYSSAATALRRLKALGHDDLVAAMDATGLARIAPAQAWPGDIVALPTDDERWGCALTVAVNNGRVLGFFNGACQPIQPLSLQSAWRVA